MPIPNEAFDTGTTLIDFFVENQDQAYSYSELEQRFGSNVWSGLFYLTIKGNIESKIVSRDVYYRLKRQPR
ncbi:MAG: hypothetical protein PHV74_13605 [Dehalococcoidia bacterium]|nr:hypothetical protein [Dehalococcoidia bacterium]